MSAFCICDHKWKKILGIDYNEIHWLLLAMELLISCMATNDYDFLEAQHAWRKSMYYIKLSY